MARAAAAVIAVAATAAVVVDDDDGDDDGVRRDEGTGGSEWTRPSRPGTVGARASDARTRSTACPGSGFVAAASVAAGFSGPLVLGLAWRRL